MTGRQTEAINYAFAEKMTGALYHSLVMLLFLVRRNECGGGAVQVSARVRAAPSLGRGAAHARSWVICKPKE